MSTGKRLLKAEFFMGQPAAHAAAMLLSLHFAGVLRLGASALCTLLLFMFTSSATDAATQFTASLDRSVIRQGESALLTLAFVGDPPNSRPNLPQIPNLQFGFPQQSQHVQIQGGEITRQVTFSYSVTTTKPGVYIIPSITATVGSRQVHSQPIELTVEAVPKDEQPAYLRLIPSKKTVYVGETFPAEIQLLVQRFRDASGLQLETEGFTVGPPVAQSQSATQIGNNFFNVVPFRMAVTPVKAGSLRLGPAKVSLTLLLPSARANDPFNLFGPRLEPRPYRLESGSEIIEVLPLPHENQPPGFQGAVGTYSISGSAGPTNVAVGDPITLRIRIAGNGSLQTLPMPQLPESADFKVYPPVTSVEPSDALGIAGLKTVEQVVIPQHAAVAAIPAISFSFFDPASKSYKTVEQALIAIKVQPSFANAPQPIVLAPSAGPETPEAKRDIVHIKPHLGQIHSSPAPLLQSAFLLLQLVPLAGWAFLHLRRRRRELLARDPRLRRRLQVRRLVNDGMKQLQTHAAARQPELFFALAFRLLQEQLGERLDLPASAITEAALDSAASGLPPELVDELRELFHICDQARFARHRSAQELEALVPRIQSAVHNLQNPHPGNLFAAPRHA